MRDLAVTGIFLISAADLTCLGHDVPVRLFQAVPLAEDVLNFPVATRFVPIFSFTFGMSMGFVVGSVIRQSAPTWRILLRRLAMLLVIGLLHPIFYPGEILCDRAAAGATLLPFALKVPRFVRLVPGLLATASAYAFTGGGALSLPGLFFLGSAAQTYGLPARLEHVDRRIGTATLVFAAVSAAAIPWQAAEGGDPRFFTVDGVVGGLMACLYVYLLALLWRVPVRRALSMVFESLGRMTLTCYVVASFVVVPAGVLLDSRSTHDVTPGPIVAAAVLPPQWVFCRLWLSRFACSPLEWAWRYVTWWRWVPLRHQQSQQPDNQSSPYRYAQLPTIRAMWTPYSVSQDPDVLPYRRTTKRSSPVVRHCSRRGAPYAPYLEQSD